MDRRAVQLARSDVATADMGRRRALAGPARRFASTDPARPGLLRSAEGRRFVAPTPRLGSRHPAGSTAGRRRRRGAAAVGSRRASGSAGAAVSRTVVAPGARPSGADSRLEDRRRLRLRLLTAHLRSRGASYTSRLVTGVAARGVRPGGDPDCGSARSVRRIFGDARRRPRKPPREVPRREETSTSRSSS